MESSWTFTVAQSERGWDVGGYSDEGSSLPKTSYPNAAKAEMTDIIERLHDDEQDAVVLWAEIHRLRCALEGPAGFASWQAAAIAERVRRVQCEAEIEALRKDAARYRWLRCNPTWLGWDHDFRPDEVERELDAAMKAQP